MSSNKKNTLVIIGFRYSKEKYDQAHILVDREPGDSESFGVVKADNSFSLEFESRGGPWRNYQVEDFNVHGQKIGLEARIRKHG